MTGQSFFEKNAPPTTPPDWVRRVNLPAPGSTKNRETIDFAVVEDLPTLVYYANLAALELHVPPSGAWTTTDRRCRPTRWCSTSTPARPPASSSARGWRSCCATC
ncbi:hypothetical protein GCM10020001_031150 [Nonomuraea salmonea]